MDNVKILISNPDFEMVMTDHLVWIVSALNAKEIKNYITGFRGHRRDLENALIHFADDACVIKVEKVNGQPQIIQGFRSITSQYELYYLIDSFGDFVLTDSFRNAISQLNIKDRIESKVSFYDHLIFPFLFSHHTYVERIKRLGKGEVMKYNVKNKRYTTHIVQKLNLTNSNLNVKEAMIKLDQELLSVTNNLINGKNSIANLLSGGIDSTLIQTFLPSYLPSVTIGMDSTELVSEIENAKEASSLLHTNHHEFVLKEEEYFNSLESTIDALGFPPINPHHVLFDAIFKEAPYTTYISGNKAGSLFGENLIKDAYLINKKRTSYHLLKELQMDTENPSGYAVRRFLNSPNLDMVMDVLGENIVQERMVNRLSYVRDRIIVDQNEENKLFAHCELGSMINYFCGDAMSIWRQLAYLNRKTIYSPFVSQRIASISVAIPASKRYFSEEKWEAKYILKELLKRKLPLYNRNKKKGLEEISKAKFCQTVPLHVVNQKYNFPEILETTHRKLVLNPTLETNNIVTALITYAIWQKRILKNPNITIIPGTKVL
ncbi:asparagine synthase (glutamine-hydrolyzing) [Evansella vedderi]|uniref:asparagine synthase (glutamine-hydrolyzing) n=1 Tax=Evansella vedderi TaxID=38282 RepID=A0ABU0A0N0_9BACI|nr:asparagine synthase-related protein [Evansella vedderi]MDQ0257044.1 asparagine synthase (glutamine-hydrolyzing) [Evansella vedderi]